MADLQEAVDVLFDQDRHDRSVQFLYDGELSPAGSRRRRQSVDSRLGLRQATLQRRGLALGQGRGAVDLHPLGPDVFLGRRSDRSGLHPGEFVSCADAFLVLMEVAQLGRLFAGDGRLDPVGELSRNGSRQGESGQVVIAASGDLAAGFQGGHLTIAGVEQSHLAEQCADAAIEGQVQGVVGGIAGMDVGGQEQSGGFGGGHHQLELREVGSVVLAVAELHQAIVRGVVVSIAGGGVEPDALDGKSIDVAVSAPESGLELLPGWEIAEPLQDQGQAIVAKLDGPDRLSDERLERLSEALDPLLNV